MSIFTSHTKEQLAVPGDPKHSITIRKLSPRSLEAAAKESQRRAIHDMKDMGGPELLKAMRELGTPDADDKPTPEPKKTVDPLLIYDHLTLIEKGVVSWTFEEQANRESYEDLDADTVEWLALEILKLSKPTLFQTDKEAVAAQKNG